MRVNNYPQDPQQNCQIYVIPTIAEGAADDTHLALRWKLRLLVTRYLGPDTKRSIKKSLIKVRNVLFPDHDIHQPTVTLPPTVHLTAGDLVRVRSKEEIQATLDSWRELKGCKFITEMGQYCGTQQRVFKSVERFMDERDYKVKKTRGLVLLDGVFCEGTAVQGRCDRSCFFFWREEWLEKLDAAPDHA